MGMRMAIAETCQTECVLKAASRLLPAGAPTRRQISAALHCALLADCDRKVDCLRKVSGMIEEGARVLGTTKT